MPTTPLRLTLKARPYTYRYKRIEKWFIDTFPKTTIELNLDSVIPATTAFYFSVSGRPDRTVGELKAMAGSRSSMCLSYCDVG